MSASDGTAGGRRSPEKIALDLYIAEGADWASLAPSRRIALAAALEASRWRGRTPDRCGFTQVRTLGPAIYGYFSQEFPDVWRQYDDRKAVTEAIQPNFVDLVFLLASDTGFLLLQDRKFHNEGPLSMPQSRVRFGLVLNSVARRLRIGPLALSPKEYVQVPKQEFLAVMAREEVWDVEIDHLDGSSIPDNVTIFNPDIDSERLIREVWTHYERENVSQMRLKRSRNGNLRNSKIAKAASYAGEPKRLVYAGASVGDRPRELRRVRKTHVPGITVHRPLTEEDALRLLEILDDLLRGAPELLQRTQSYQQLDLGIQL